MESKIPLKQHSIDLKKNNVKHLKKKKRSKFKDFVKQIETNVQVIDWSTFYL